MKFKKSIFNIEVDKLENNKALYFNSMKGNYIKLNDEYNQVLNHIGESDIRLEENMIAKDLYDQGLIVEKNINELDVFKLKSDITRYENQSYEYTLAVTLDCNMACPYCYEKNESKYMIEEVQDKIIEHMELKMIDGMKFLRVTWYGGEPLLNFEAIERMSKKILNIAKKYGVQYSASIITNGLLLSERVAKELSEYYKVRYAQVTIDGLKDTHNKRRITKDSSDGFSRIIKNIKEASKHLNIAIRINIDKNNKSEIKELTNYLYKELDTKKVIIYIAAVESKGSSSYEGCLTFPDFVKVQSEFLNEILDTKLVEKFYPYPKTIACGAQCLNTAVIDPEGNIFKCWEEVAVKGKAVGNVFNSKTNVNNLLKYVQLEMPKECESCAYIPLCHGGCPHTRLLNNNKPACARNTTSIQTILKKYYKVWLEQVNKVERA